MSERLPLHDVHATAGARFDTSDGWETPRDYGDAAAEYDSVRRAAGVLERGHWGVLEVTGRDRASFLHAMLSNDVKSLEPGQGCAASFLDVHGKLQAFLWILALDDRILVLTPPGLAASTMEALDTYLFSEKAVFADTTGALSLLLLAGPEAPAVVTKLTGVAVPEAAWSHVTAPLDGVAIRLVRGGGETGESEVWLVGPARHAEWLWNAVVTAGARPIGGAAFESLRIEAGTPVFGRDADPTVLLPEVPFADKVSYSKGCYIGQEVVVRIRDRGHVNRMLRGLLVDGEVVPRPGDAIVAADAEIGRVTSPTWSFGLKRPIALGLVRRYYAEPGTPVAVRLADGGHATAAVSALPFAR